MKKFEALVSVISPMAGGRRVSMAVSILFIVHGAEDSSTQNRNYYCWAPVYPLSSVYLM